MFNCIDICVCVLSKNECADPVQDIPIAETIVHENYTTSRIPENDIALIRLQRPVAYTEFIRPICLPIKELRNKVYDGIGLTTAGFGKTAIGMILLSQFLKVMWANRAIISFAASQSPVKLKLQVNGFNFERCSNVYQTKSTIALSHKQMCAGGEEGKGTCNGDSGMDGIFHELDRSDSWNDPQPHIIHIHVGNALWAEHSDGGQSFNYVVGIVSFGQSPWFV